MTSYHLGKISHKGELFPKAEKPPFSPWKYNKKKSSPNVFPDVYFAWVSFVAGKVAKMRKTFWGSIRRIMPVVSYLLFTEVIFVISVLLGTAECTLKVPCEKIYITGGVGKSIHTRFSPHFAKSTTFTIKKRKLHRIMLAFNSIATNFPPQYLFLNKYCENSFSKWKVYLFLNSHEQRDSLN